MWVTIRLLRVIAATLMMFTASAQAEDLAAAVASGKVSAEFEAMGGSSGDVMAVTVKKLDKNGPDIPLTVRAGTRLKTGNADEQEMYIAGLKGLLMNGDRYRPVPGMEASDEPATYVLDAYCAEFEKENPSPGGGYAVGAVDAVAACILVKAAQLSTTARQAAIWIHTDQVSYAKINEKFRVKKAEWKAAESVTRQCRNVHK